MKEKITSPSRKEESKHENDGFELQRLKWNVQLVIDFVEKNGGFQRIKIQIECVMVSDFHDDKNMA